ncbi:MAG: hypothetical protein K5650_05765 [Bacteroidales bacterium]|nr:hypothetical protein [Bacteroidales bacterium]
MKRLILPLIALMALTFTTSCDRDDYNSFSDVVVLQANDWHPHTAVVYDANGNPNPYIDYYYATVQWNALTEEVVDNGQVHAYIYTNGAQNPLPFIVPVSCPVDVLDSTGAVIGTDYQIVGENLRFIFEPGYIQFIIEDLDGNPPSDMLNIPNYTIRICAVRP